MCAMGPRGELHPVGLEISHETAIVRGRRGVHVVESRRIHALDRAAARPVTDDAPSDFAPRGVDAADRIYGLSGGHVVSFGRDGWRLHLAALGPEPE
jgi:hypothetical protein